MPKGKFQEYIPSKIEIKWQKRWEETGIYQPNLRNAKKPRKASPRGKPFYNLMMFPYPSAEGMHVGNMYAFTGSDIYGRLKRMRGHSVFEPIGLDGFGIHSENYAINIDEHPSEVSKRTEKHFYEQLQATGNGYDWRTRLETYDPKYYRWTQWIFVEMFKAGLAYRKKASVNWCPSCKTVLADEQVVTGVCERCKNKVTQRKLEQWFFRITDYAERLLKNLDWIDWSEKIKIAQRNWIGKKEGALIKFQIPNSKFQIESFTTRPDTLYGATFFVLSPEHPVVALLLNSKLPGLAKRSGAGKTPRPRQAKRGGQNSKLEEIKKYVKKTQKISRQDRLENKKKTGVFTGLYVINPATNKKIPVYVADYIVMDYGTGAIMGVPGHDERDWNFARKYKLPVVEVISGDNIKKRAYEGEGKIVNSGSWNGLKMPGDLDKVIAEVEKKDWGKSATTYHLRDWLISRQRYWGPPIPMIFCKLCKSTGQGERKEMPGWYSVLERDLPVELPYIKNYQPRGTGESPLAQAKEWVKVKCPGCGSDAKRETDVSDTFLDSSWYFFRYPSIGQKNSTLEIGNWKLEIPWNRQITRKWLPVDLYIGGAEHAVLHLLYTRFITMAFKDLGFIDFEEPFKRFYAHGLLIKDGAKMSKSRGNVVVPDEYIKKFGADTLRPYLMFLGPYNQGGDFRNTGIEGMHRFLNRVWRLVAEYKYLVLVGETDARTVLVKQHQTIQKVTQDIERLSFNTAIAAIMEFVNALRDVAQKNAEIHAEKSGTKLKNQSPITNHQSQIRCAEWDEALRVLVQLLAPFAPHITEEIWVNILGEKFSIHISDWPKYKKELVKEETVTIVVQVDGKLRATLTLKAQSSPASPSEAGRARLKAQVVRRAKADEKIKKWLKGKRVSRTIFVPGKLINFVTK
jgi:leucyl-tRNA synthetase